MPFDTPPSGVPTSISAASACEAREHLVRLLAATGDRDKDAFRDLYDRTTAKLFGICLRICSDRSAAEDVLHDVYLIIWNRAGSYQQGLGSPITWLCAIARNRAIDWRRGQNIRDASPITDAFDVPDCSPSAEALILVADTSRRLHLHLAELDIRQSNAIRRAFFDGYTYAELAESEGVPLGTMKSWVRRGLYQIRLRLEEGEG